MYFMHSSSLSAFMAALDLSRASAASCFLSASVIAAIILSICAMWASLQRSCAAKAWLKPNIIKREARSGAFDMGFLHGLTAFRKEKRARAAKGAGGLEGVRLGARQRCAWRLRARQGQTGQSLDVIGPRRCRP